MAGTLKKFFSKIGGFFERSIKNETGSKTPSASGTKQTPRTPKADSELSEIALSETAEEAIPKGQFEAITHQANDDITHQANDDIVFFKYSQGRDIAFVTYYRGENRIKIVDGFFKILHGNFVVPGEEVNKEYNDKNKKKIERFISDLKNLIGQNTGIELDAEIKKLIRQNTGIELDAKINSLIRLHFLLKLVENQPMDSILFTQKTITALSEYIFKNKDDSEVQLILRKIGRTKLEYIFRQSATPIEIAIHRKYFDEIFREISINLADGSSLILELNKTDNKGEDSESRYYVSLNQKAIEKLIEEKKSASDIVEAIKTQLDGQKIYVDKQPLFTLDYYLEINATNFELILELIKTNDYLFEDDPQKLAAYISSQIDEQDNISDDVVEKLLEWKNCEPSESFLSWDEFLELTVKNGSYEQSIFGENKKKVIEAVEKAEEKRKKKEAEKKTIIRPSQPQSQPVSRDGSLKSIPFPNKPIKLYNSGNDCYINAILQIILNMPAFTEFIMQIDTTGADKEWDTQKELIQKIIAAPGDKKNKDVLISQINTADPSVKQKKIVRELQRLVVKKLSLKPEKDITLHTHSLATLVFGSNEQQDAQEFYQVIRDAIEKTLPKEQSTVFKDYFVDATYVSTFTSKNEPALIQQGDPLTSDIELIDIGNGGDLQTLISTSLKGETDFSGENAYEFLDGKKRDAIQTRRYTKLPSVVVAPLKRWQANQIGENQQKVYTEVDVLEELDLSVNNTTKKYKLYGVVNHGGELNGGHYTTLLNAKMAHIDGCGKFLTASDILLTNQDSLPERSSEPYLYFYVEEGKEEKIFKESIQVNQKVFEELRVELGPQTQPTDVEVDTPKTSIDPDSDYIQALELEDKNMNEAKKIYERLVKQNHLNAMLRLADIYEKGTGGVQDMNKAIELYRQAANELSLDAMLRLADIYENGIGGITKNQNEAFVYYELAAAFFEYSNVAIYNLARCYENGIGVEKDKKKAIELYQQAVKHGSDLAKERLDILKKKDEEGDGSGDSGYDYEENGKSTDEDSKETKTPETTQKPQEFKTPKQDLLIKQPGKENTDERLSKTIQNKINEIEKETAERNQRQPETKTVPQEESSLIKALKALQLMAEKYERCQGFPDNIKVEQGQIQFIEISLKESRQNLKALRKIYEWFISGKPITMAMVMDMGDEIEGVDKTIYQKVSIELFMNECLEAVQETLKNPNNIIIYDFEITRNINTGVLTIKVEGIGKYVLPTSIELGQVNEVVQAISNQNETKLEELGVDIQSLTLQSGENIDNNRFQAMLKYQKANRKSSLANEGNSGTSIPV